MALDKKNWDDAPGGNDRTVHRLPLKGRRSILPSHMTTYPVAWGSGDWAVVIVEHGDGKVTMALELRKNKK